METPSETSTPLVDVNFTLGLGEQKLHLSLRVPSGETNITELLPVLQQVTNAVVGKSVAQIEAFGQHVSCRPACGACCRQLVPVSIFEVEALAQWIRSLPEAEQLALQGRFHAALLALREAGILARITPELWEEGSLESRNAVLDYLAAKVPCPFLQDESCGIYPIRPLVCREYLVTSPPEFCAGPELQKVEGVRIPMKLSKALNLLGGKVEEDAKGWIPLVFLFHWMKAGAEPGKAVSGVGPELLYEVISQLEA